MFTNAEMIKMIMEEKGISVYDLYIKLGKIRNVYVAFEENKFTEKLIRKIESVVGEDLSMFINCK